MSARSRLTKLAKDLSYRSKPKPQLREAAKKGDSWTILRGDKVQVIGNHPERGKQGIVKEVIREKDRVIVEGVNMGPHRMKGDKERGIPARTVQRERSMHSSNVNLVDPVHNVPTRVSKQYLDTGEKIRVSKKSGAIIPRPEILKLRKRPVRSTVTSSDTTSDEDVWAITYDLYMPTTAKES